jgi:hypothetical protein
MRTKFFVTIMLVAVLPLRLSASAGTAPYTKDDDFKSVVKMIEKFYSVKHVGIPFLAKAGMKLATTAARIKGGEAKRIAEAGSIKLAVFENQEFAGDFTKFRASLNEALNDSWMPLMQTLSATSQDQNYIFLRDAGQKFNVLVITITQRDATVVQVDISGKNLALLLRDPEGTGKTITEEATIVDQE